MRPLEILNHKAFLKHDLGIVLFATKKQLDKNKNLKDTMAEVQQKLPALPIQYVNFSLDAKTLKDFRFDKKPQPSPTLIIYKQGIPVKTITGFQVPKTYIQAIQNQL